MKRSLILAGLLLGVPLAASAVEPARCQINAMTDAKFCSTSEAREGTGPSYVYASGHSTEGMSLIVHQGGLASRWHPDAILVRINGGAPVRMKARPVNADVDCNRYRVCTWTATAYADPTKEQWQQLADAQSLLVALAQGDGVADPISVDPATVRGWLESLAAEGMTPR